MRMRYLILAFLLFTSGASAQVGFSLYTSSTYDDNSFSFYEKREDVYHALFGALTAGTTSGSSYLQAYYYGALVQFRTYSDRTYHVHTVGGYSQFQLDYLNDESADEQAQYSSLPSNVVRGPAPAPPPAEEFSDSLVTYLFVIPQVGARFDHDNWDFYDFRRASLLLRLRRHVSGELMSMLHVTSQLKSYPNLTQFTHLEVNGGVVLGHPLTKSMDAFIALDAGHKIYTETVSDTTWVTDGKPGKGKG